RKTSRSCHCETSPQTGRGNPYPPVPISNVFKSQFENTTIFNFQLSIFNSHFARGRVHVAVNDRRYGGVRGTAGGQ
ncbi:MAG: hypothetical protein IKQ04_10285, partial [Oscillospiraceae bacterium]|nr:hypothetical protein [Oscillospiraceae bacterium]